MGKHEGSSPLQVLRFRVTADLRPEARVGEHQTGVIGAGRPQFVPLSIK